MPKARPPHHAAEGLPKPSLFNAQIYAQTVAQGMFPDSQEKQDAARHMLAAALYAQKLSPGIADLLGKAHEFKEAPARTAGHWLGLGEPRADYPTDTHNNALGAQTGAAVPDLNQLLYDIERQVNAGAPTIQPGTTALIKDPDVRYAQGGTVQSSIYNNPDAMRLALAQNQQPQISNEQLGRMAMMRSLIGA